ncbi:MAG TPA: hypothetical protein VLW49_11880 [Gaiellaceae bacterium]|nr:hypothetical protein [Gaiellaceae bacterium]
MRGKRFGFLAAALVAINLGLWLAPPGLALRQALINQLFGPRMVRAEVIYKTGPGATGDMRLDRGVVTAQTPTDITLTELDGRVQDIPLGSSTRIRRNSLVGWRVLVEWPANGTAISVQPEARIALNPSSGSRRNAARK